MSTHTPATTNLSGTAHDNAPSSRGAATQQVGSGGQPSVVTGTGPPSTGQQPSGTIAGTQPSASTPAAQSATTNTKGKGSAEPEKKFMNKDCLWLTYESVFNNPLFQHTEKKQYMGCFTMPAKELKVIASTALSSGKLEQLRLAFFPQIEKDKFQTILYRPWTQSMPDDADVGKPNLEGIWTAKQPDSWKTAVGQLPDTMLANMPYNVVAHGSNAIAIGSAPNDPNLDIKISDSGWPMWQTASRSCIIQLAPEDKPVLPISGQKLFSEQTTPESKFLKRPSVTTRSWNTSVDVTPPDSSYTPSGPDKSAFDFCSHVKDGAAQCFSIKTGVCFVGQTVQDGRESRGGAGGKGTLEKEAAAAALQSEYIATIAALFKGRALVKELMDEVIVLPEILTVVCTNPKYTIVKGPADKKKSIVDNDGFQLRDIGGLNPEKTHFPPISIPFLGVGTPVDFKTLEAAWSFVDNQKGRDGWKEFWKKNYAKRIGRAKAILHLCYGLQHLSPNAQNFLLEFGSNMNEPPVEDNNEKVGQTAVRDVLDFKLHTEWVRTVCGPPLKGKNGPYHPASLKALSDSSEIIFDNECPKEFEPLWRLLNFERTMPSAAHPETTILAESETFFDYTAGGADTVQFYKGIQLNYFDYSALIKARDIFAPKKTTPQGETRPKNWPYLLQMNAEWGLGHATAYLDTLYKVLKLPALDPETLLSDIKPFNKNCSDEGQTNPFGAPLNLPNKAMELGQLNENDSKNWEAVSSGHDALVGWDRAVSWQVQKAIYGSWEGRYALRNFLGLEK